MLDRLRGLFSGSPRVGDLVTVLRGENAGRTGTIIQIARPGFTVFIDDCCQPVLERDTFRREWRGRGIAGAARKARESDTEGELARLAAAYRDRDNSVF